MKPDFYQKLIIQTMSKIQVGCLILELPDGSQHFCGRPGKYDPVVWKVHNTACFKAIVLGQDIGLGESYIEGLWEVNDLTALLRLFIENRSALQSSRYPLISTMARTLLLGWERIQHMLRSNTRKQSERNIHAHYDLGNPFYETFLDKGMAYSSAYFSGKNEPLEDAQFEKNDRLCRKLALAKHHHLLEIGSGWGGMALHAAQHYGCRVTSVTISREQHDYACKRVKEAGLEDRVEIRFQDYRDIEGKYDRIVSVEMLEAVGHEHLETYFSQCAKLLKPDGILGLQVILSPDSRYKYYRNRVDYIRKHIFPGGHLPSITSIQAQVGRKTDWDLQHFESFGKHYAETLRRWGSRFKETRERRQELGFDDCFERKWEFYFCYCEAGFDSRHIQVGQFIYAAPNNPELAVEEARASTVSSTTSQRTQA
jgi:cyclopropane-fatty-acyl-phospholipid synthase